MKSELFIPPSIKAVFWDMDGVIVNSEEIWEKVEGAFVDRFVSGLSKKDYQAFLGCSIRGIYELLLKRFPENMLKVEWEDFFAAYKTYGLENVYGSTLLMPGVGEVMRLLKSKGIPMALVSSSPWDWIRATLDRHDLDSYFEVMVSGEDFLRAKPAPDVYLAAANQLEVLPCYGLVIEDSKNGIMAGKKAGMTVWGYDNGFNVDQDLSDSDVIFKNFNCLQYE